MEVIPIHYKVSAPVRKYFEIEDDAANMMDMLDRRGFRGHHSAGYALAHAQVSNNPKSFFVLDRALIEDGSFTERVIINPRILRANVFDKATMKSSLDPLLGSNPRPNYKEYSEGCLSFPFRKGRRINRFDKIKVSYYVKGGLFGLKKRTRWLSGLASQVFQHEFDHCRGQNIYFDGPKEPETVSYTAGLPEAA